MKLLFSVAFCVATILSAAQVSINPQLPPAGLSLRSQLWNIMAINPTPAGMTVFVELRVTEINSNSQVFTATSNHILLTPGSQLIQAGSWMPVQYNFTDPLYHQFSNSEFLPVGQFIVCYGLMVLQGDGFRKMQEECEPISIEPASPPQLVYPYHQSGIEEQLPLFNWLPPAPLQLFSDPTYELQVAEIYNGQTETDAIQENIPIVYQAGIAGTVFPYPSVGILPEKGKKYAWRVMVRSNDAIVAQSEVWWFMIKEQPGDKVQSSTAAYAKLKKGVVPGYTIAKNILKFEYVNETMDTVWNIVAYDITNSKPRQVHLEMDSVPLRRGVNLVRLPLYLSEVFKNKGLYLIQVRNRRNETWQLKFEYRRED